MRNIREQPCLARDYAFPTAKLQLNRSTTKFYGNFFHLFFAIS